MIKVKISLPIDRFPFLRQTPGGKGIWDDCQFYVNHDIEECDYWFVFDSLLKDESTVCNPANVILVTGEPLSVKKFNSSFLNQFGAVITSQAGVKHKNVSINQTGLPWYAGVSYIKEKKQWDSENFMIYDDFLKPLNHQRNKLISIITSSKTMTNGHKNRLEFVEAVKNKFGDQVDIFGNGFQSIPDKFDVLKEYKYSIVIENSSYPDYWTEKLADAFLSETYPIYYGCSNVHDYFSNQCLSVINIDYVDEALIIIDDVINKQSYEKSLEYLYQAKIEVMNNYNFFALITNYIHKNINNELDFKQEVIIKKDKGFIPEMKNIIKKIINRH